MEDIIAVIMYCVVHQLHTDIADDKSSIGKYRRKKIQEILWKKNHALQMIAKVFIVPNMNFFCHINMTLQHAGYNSIYQKLHIELLCSTLKISTPQRQRDRISHVLNCNGGGSYLNSFSTVSKDWDSFYRESLLFPLSSQSMLLAFTFISLLEFPLPCSIVRLTFTSYQKLSQYFRYANK